jgi:hypothetical protein
VPEPVAKVTKTSVKKAAEPEQAVELTKPAEPEAPSHAQEYTEEAPVTNLDDRPTKVSKIIEKPMEVVKTVEEPLPAVERPAAELQPAQIIQKPADTEEPKPVRDEKVKPAPGPGYEARTEEASLPVEPENTEEIRAEKAAAEKLPSILKKPKEPSPEEPGPGTEPEVAGSERPASPREMSPTPSDEVEPTLIKKKKKKKEKVSSQKFRDDDDEESSPKLIGDYGKEDAAAEPPAVAEGEVRRREEGRKVSTSVLETSENNLENDLSKLSHKQTLKEPRPRKEAGAGPATDTQPSTAVQQTKDRDTTTKDRSQQVKVKTEIDKPGPDGKSKMVEDRRREPMSTDTQSHTTDIYEREQVK